MNLSNQNMSVAVLLYLCVSWERNHTRWPTLACGNELKWRWLKQQLKITAGRGSEFEVNMQYIFLLTEIHT